MKQWWLTALMIAFMWSVPMFSFDQTPKKVSLIWTPNVEGDLSGYKVYRTLNTCAAATNASMMFVSVVPAPTATFTDALVPAGTKDVCYAVTAFDTSQNESPFSNKAGKSLNFAPSAPTAPSFR